MHIQIVINVINLCIFECTGTIDLLSVMYCSQKFKKRSIISQKAIKTTSKNILNPSVPREVRENPVLCLRSTGLRHDDRPMKGIPQSMWLSVCTLEGDRASVWLGQRWRWVYRRGRWGSILHRESLDWHSLMYPRRSPRRTWWSRCRRRRFDRAQVSIHPCRCNSDLPMCSYRTRL